jgi:hypothetical protein
MNASKSSTLRSVIGLRQVAVKRNKKWVPKWEGLGGLGGQSKVLGIVSAGRQDASLTIGDPRQFD